jgi:cell division septation protein DedD
VALEDRLKQRLTGAAILVALVVLIVPEMFKGRPPAHPAQLPIAPNGAPQRSYTLNLEERGPTDSVPQSASPPAAAQSPPPAASSPEPLRSSPAQSVADSDSDGASAAAAPSNAASTEHGSTADHVAATPASPTHASTPVAHAPAAATHPGAPSPAAGKVGWTVQLGSFQQAENAHRMAQKLAAKGIKTLVVGPDARGYYRVRTPEVADMATAESLRERLLTQGFKGVIGTTP